ncbi:hypothetical protein L1049_006664 [Liquidambar formosana]|uniref:Uncharacterized protein n=1 Tax=Liquidambar formosana TaxID=63359 RepID=A0AAP0RFW9_LIQFO
MLMLFPMGFDKFLFWRSGDPEHNALKASLVKLARDGSCSELPVLFPYILEFIAFVQLRMEHAATCWPHKMHVDFYPPNHDVSYCVGSCIIRNHRFKPCCGDDWASDAAWSLVHWEKEVD